ncbi:MAG: hypothetical protein DRJ59_06210 [Thermoprotei archaeon]|nr:MAG: hypothetical protein DRJ59_06210 [Thermoprotei archaeon]
MRLTRLGSINLEPPEEFNFHLTASAYSFHWQFDGKYLYFPVIRNPLLIVRTSVKDNVVRVDLYGVTGKLSKDLVTEHVVRTLGLDEKYYEFYNIAEGDPLLAEVARSLRGMRLRTTDLWTALIIAVCQQNASFKQGWRMLYNLFKMFGERVTVEGHGFLLTPPPSLIAKSSSSELMRAGIGYRASTLLELARGFDDIPQQSPRELERSLRSFKGVGLYTARLALLLAHRFYELPPVDRWTARIVCEVYGCKGVSISEAEEVLRKVWGKWSGLAVYYLTIVLDAEPLSKALDRVRKGLLKPYMSSDKLTPLTLYLRDWFVS